MKRSRCAAAPVLVLFCLVSSAYSADIRVTAPNGGETWYLGSTHDITWTARDISGAVQIVLTRAKLNVRVIHSFTSDVKGIKMGRFPWTIPGDLPTGSNFKIEIICRVGKTIIQDESDRVFSLQKRTLQATKPEIPRVRVLSPNGGETIRNGQTISIRWWSNVDFSGANIDFHKADRGVVRRLTVVRATGPAADGSYSHRFTIPSDFPAGRDYRLRIWGYEGRVSDQSDSPFTIGLMSLPEASLTVNYPRPGEVWYRTDNQMITWTATGVTQNLKVFVTTHPAYPIALNVGPRERGVMWSNIGRIGDVIIPNSEAVIRIETMDGSLFAESRRFFIRTPEVTVNSPAGGSLVGLGSTITIRWAAPHLGGNVNLALYSAPKSGGAFTRVRTLIASNTANDGSQRWRVTATRDLRYRIRVESVRQSSVYGESGIFTLRLKL
jgi:hypothetical protein